MRFNLNVDILSQTQNLAFSLFLLSSKLQRNTQRIEIFLGHSVRQVNRNFTNLQI